VLCHLKVRNNCVGFFRLFRRKAAGMLAAFQGSAASHGGKKTGDNFRYLPDGVLGAWDNPRRLRTAPPSCAKGAWGGCCLLV